MRTTCLSVVATRSTDLTFCKKRVILVISKVTVWLWRGSCHIFADSAFVGQQSQLQSQIVQITARPMGLMFLAENEASIYMFNSTSEVGSVKSEVESEMRVGIVHCEPDRKGRLQIRKVSKRSTRVCSVW